MHYNNLSGLLLKMFMVERFELSLNEQILFYLLGADANSHPCFLVLIHVKNINIYEKGLSCTTSWKLVKNTMNI